MSYKYFLLPASAKDDGMKQGWAYIKAHKSEAIQNDEAGPCMMPGYNNGCDFIIKDDVCYFVRKAFVDISENVMYILAVESVNGCDTREF